MLGLIVSCTGAFSKHSQKWHFYPPIGVQISLYGNKLRQVEGNSPSPVRGSIFYCIMRKVKIDNFFCFNGNIWNLFLHKCLLSSPQRFTWLLSKSLNLIGYQGEKRVNFRRRKKLNNLLRNRKVDEADTFHTCL